MDNSIVLFTGLPDDVIKMAEYTGKEGKYEIFGFVTEGKSPQPLIETPVFKMYVSKLPSGQIGLMKINTKPEHIGTLKSEYRALSTLQQISEQLDAEAISAGDVPPNHGAMIPQVIEMLQPDEDRVVIFLGYHASIQTYRQMKPLSFLTHEGRIDLKSSAWILGKMLKTVAYVHSLDFSINRLDSTNIMLETDVHGTFVLDFSKANDEPTDEEIVADVMNLAKSVWIAAGGDDEVLPNHDVEIMTDEEHIRFCEFLRELMDDGMDSNQAHKESYKLFDSIWPRKRKQRNEEETFLKRDFHEWVTYKRKRS